MNNASMTDRRKLLLATGGLVAMSQLLKAPVAQAQAPAQLNPQPLPPSPGWTRALPTGPDTRSKMTEAYAVHLARDAYFWAWPMTNIYNRRLAFTDVKEIVMAGPVPSAPLNRFAMLTDYITPEQRLVACPNQDVVYGAGSIALDVTPVVIQVPDFGDRFWVYQVVNLRTDGVVQLGKMYGTTPGFYMLVGPNWRGEVPNGITQVFRSSTNTGFIAPRVFLDDTPEDKKAIQSVLRPMQMYPVAEYDGTMKTTDWSQIKKMPAAAASGEGETQWVFPEKFFDELPAVLADAPPLPGEEARYAQVHALLAASKNNPALKPAVIKAAAEADDAARQAAVPVSQLWPAASAPLVDDLQRGCVRHRLLHPHGGGEVKHPGQLAERDEVFLSGPRCIRCAAQRRQQLHCDLPEGADAPVNGFWSLTLYNEHHFFVPNELNRYSLGHQEQNVEAERGRLAHVPCAGGLAAAGAARQLAAVTKRRRLLAVCPCLLAEEPGHGGLVDSASGAEGVK